MHGIRLQEIKGQYQLMTAPEFASEIESFLGLEVTSRLTQAALEALAIVLISSLRPALKLTASVGQ